MGMKQAKRGEHLEATQKSGRTFAQHAAQQGCLFAAWTRHAPAAASPSAPTGPCPTFN